MSPEVWRGTISFSLVAIPVRLVEAISPDRVSFRMLHREDHAPLVSRMLCPDEGKIVPREEIIRGYEFKPGKYIPISAAELETVAPERSRTIEVTAFVSSSEVDTVYFDHQYYMVPMKGGEKPYRLLVEVLRRSAKAGVASLVLAEREFPVIVRSVDGLLAVNTLHYPDDIVTTSSITKTGDNTSAKTGTVTRRVGRSRSEGLSPVFAGAAGMNAEKERMKRVIGKMVAKFDPEKYADQRRERVVALLKKKMKGNSLVQAPEVEEADRKVPADLVAVLEASMRKGKKDE
jgi:DNA end-binding protein Ku